MEAKLVQETQGLREQTVAVVKKDPRVTVPLETPLQMDPKGPVVKFGPPRERPTPKTRPKALPTTRPRTSGKLEEDWESFGKDISRLSERGGDSRLRELKQQVTAFFSQLKRHDVLRVFRIMLSREGIGKWADLPKTVQKQIMKCTLETIDDPEWLERQIRYRMRWDRSWAPSPMARALLVQASFVAMSRGAAVLGTE